MFPLLITLGPRKEQLDPEEMFFNEWPRWIRDLTGFEIEVQFLRVVESGPSVNVHCEGKPCTSTTGHRFLTPSYRRWQIPLKEISEDIQDGLNHANNECH